MAKIIRGAIVLAALALVAAARPAEASFHLWTISEVYSDSTGTIQFIELSCPSFGTDEIFLGGHTIVASNGGQTHTFTFPNDLSGNTASKHLLIATAGYAALGTSVTPDFIIPSNFLFAPAGTVVYAEGIDSETYANLPSDAGHSLAYPGGSVATDTPTNFAGASGPVPGGSDGNPLKPIQKGDFTVELKTVATGFVSPLGLAVPDDGSGRIFIYDQTGPISVLHDGAVSGTPLLNVASRLASLAPNYDERGLLGMACHPDFANHPKFYTCTSEPVGGTPDFTNIGGSQDHMDVFAEWTMTGSDPDATTANPASRRELLRIAHPAGNHNGGSIRFGPDGFLYIGIGDGGNGNDSGNGHVAGGNGQSILNVYGKILRIDVDGSNSANGKYGIPAGNPFAGAVAGVDEIFIHGLRNPFSFSFDKALTNPAAFQLYIGDVGQNNLEEVDRVTPANGGGNFGWPVREGSFFFNMGTGNVSLAPPGSVPPNLIEPIAEYDHDDGSAVIGGFVYRGSIFPQLVGHYVFGELNGRLFYLDDAGAIKEFQIGLDDHAFGLVLKGFGQDADGEIYVCASSILGPSGTTGVIQRLSGIPTGAGRWELYR